MANAPQFVDDEVPAELAESSFTFAAEVVAIGFAMPPQSKLDSAARGGFTAPTRLFVQEIRPLDHDIDTNKESFIFDNEGNNYRDWLRYLDKNGQTITSKSPFGDVKAAYKKLGIDLLTSQQMQRDVVGKKFRFQSVGKKYFDDQAKPTWFNIPVAQLEDNYEFTGKKWLKKRGYEGQETAANKLDSAIDEEATAVLIPALEGKTPSEFVMAVATAGYGQKGPFMLWAAQNGGQALVEWAARKGLTVENGRLTRN